MSAKHKGISTWLHEGIKQNYRAIIAHPGIGDLSKENPAYYLVSAEKGASTLKPESETG